ncbi:MAG: hypothetical protein LBG87_07925 [Spirochaetaceae bacterium]|jgi:hypothetical protein|nr:hypothetical protein [Spirochaetaceae bacterium]
MNQDQIKNTLLSLEDAPMDFTVLFSGKQSKKVNGLYNPESREIVIHNRNFTDDNLLLYTAIHEYAHHLHACSQGGRLSIRSHTAEFWAILHRLLEKAESSGVYKNVFDDSPELNELTKTIRQRFLQENGSLVKDLGMYLLRAHELCAVIGGRFEDYIDRVLRIPRTAATTAMKIYQYNLNTSVGADNMRFLAAIRNENERMTAEAALLKGESPDTVRSETKRRTVRAPSPEEEPKLRLEKEKNRLERTIASLSKRLNEVQRELEHLGEQ